VKRTVLIAAAVLVPMLLATGGNASRAVRPRVGFVSYSGTTPTRHTLPGLPLVGFLRAERQLPIRGRVEYVGPGQGSSTVLESFARQGYDLVVAPLFDPESVGPMARRFPHVRFVVVDAQPIKPPLNEKNVHRVVFRAEEAGYLAGYLAALMARREHGGHVISAVGGWPFYGVRRWIVGYRAGAEKADRKVEVRVDYSNDFSNPAKCRRVALGQIAAGSRVVFDVAGACGVGALRAAQQKGVWGIGVDVDHSFLGPYILTSAVDRLDRAVFVTLRQFVRGGLDRQTTVFAVRNGGVELGRISPEVPKTLLQKVAHIRRQIADGAINVPRAHGY
jgi:basic membrane protein A and related proteins